MPFDWTVNPYRGCTHACIYCFARGTHEYLDLDAGADFDSQIVVIDRHAVRPTPSQRVARAPVLDKEVHHRSEREGEEHDDHRHAHEDP